MHLEGTIRALGLHEVAQLVALSRRSGVLIATSPADARASWIRFRDGGVVDAGRGAPPEPPACTPAAAEAREAAVREAALAVLAWRDGQFAFREESAAVAARVRLGTDGLLVAAIERDDAWAAFADRLPGPHCVPAYPDVEAQQLPLLQLSADEWEVLTAIDGERDVPALAEVIGRDVLVVADALHRLIGTGLVCVRDLVGTARPTAPRGTAAVAEPHTHATPPAAPAALPAPPPPRPPTPARIADLWIPSQPLGMRAIDDGDDDDTIFDPLTDVLLVPHARKVASGAADPSSAREAVGALRAGDGARPAVSPSLAGRPSPAATPSRASAPDGMATPLDAGVLAAAGDAAARRGEFGAALAAWRGALDAAPAADDVARLREAVMLVRRLVSLLDTTA